MYQRTTVQLNASSIPWLLDARWSHLGTLALVPTDGVGGALLVFLLQEAVGHFLCIIKCHPTRRSCSESIRLKIHHQQPR